MQNKAANRQFDERDVILREMSHRTANTLQRVLAALHFARRGDASMLELAAAQVGGAARVHSLLALSNDSCVDIAPFLKDLCDAIQAGWGSGSEIAIERDFQSLFMPVLDAKRLAMIVFELISNAIEHAFPDGTGRVFIALHDDAAHTRLLIEDDGVCHGWRRPDGQGAQIIDALVGILQGRIKRSITASGSLRVNLTFPSFAILSRGVSGAA